MFERKKYKSFAKKQLNGRYGIPVLMTFLIFLAGELFSIPTQRLSIPASQLQTEITDSFSSGNFEEVLSLLQNYQSGQNAFLNLFLRILGFVVAAIFSFSAIKVYLMMSRTPEKINFKSYIEGMNDWWRAILSNLYEEFRLLLWSLIPIAVTILYLVISLVIIFTAGDSFSGASLAVIFVLSIAALASLIPLIIKSIAYRYTTYFAAEYSSISVTEALELSNRITKKNKWNIFVLDLSFIGWFLLGAITFGIGLLWIIPYFQLSNINTYHALLQQALDSGSIKPEELSISNSENSEAFSTQPGTENTETKASSDTQE